MKEGQKLKIFLGRLNLRIEESGGQTTLRRTTRTTTRTCYLAAPKKEFNMYINQKKTIMKKDKISWITLSWFWRKISINP